MTPAPPGPPPDGPALGYCLNVHPAETVDALVAALEGPARAAAAAAGAPLGAGLWLPREVASALATDDGAVERVRAALAAGGLFAFTANAFPIGGFHAARVKEAVYRPTWLEPLRLDFTLDACRALARLLPPGARGSVSTVPVSFRAFGHDDPTAPTLARAGALLGAAALALRRLEGETGRALALALEPEPRCTLETTGEAAAFLEAHVFGGAGRDVLRAAGLPDEEAEAELRDRVGLCVDACHLACVFEPLPEALEALARRGVRVVKAQLSSALELRLPADRPAARARLAGFAEPRYLHQTHGQRPGPAGAPVRVDALDLPDALAADGALAPAFEGVDVLRTHFHVPLAWPGDGDDVPEGARLTTTRPELERGLAALARATDHLEVETYTFDVLPAAVRAQVGGDVAAMTAREVAWARAALAEALPERRARAGPG